MLISASKWPNKSSWKKFIPVSQLRWSPKSTKWLRWKGLCSCRTEQSHGSLWYHVQPGKTIIFLQSYLDDSINWTVFSMPIAFASTLSVTFCRRQMLIWQSLTCSLMWLLLNFWWRIVFFGMKLSESNFLKLWSHCWSWGLFLYSMKMMLLVLGKLRMRYATLLVPILFHLKFVLICVLFGVALNKSQQLLRARLVRFLFLVFGFLFLIKDREDKMRG